MTPELDTTKAEYWEKEAEWLRKRAKYDIQKAEEYEEIARTCREKTKEIKHDT